MLLNSILCPRPEASSCLEIWSIPLLPTIAHSTPPHPYHNFTTFNSMHLTEPCIWNQPWNEQVSADASGPLTGLSLCHFPSQSLQQTPPPPQRGWVLYSLYLEVSPYPISITNTHLLLGPLSCPRAIQCKQ